MNILTRHKVFLLITLITVLLWLGVLIFCQDSVLIGYRVHNGIEDHIFVSKPEGIIRVVFSTAFVALLWEALAIWINEKIQSAPELSSFKVWRGAIYTVCCIWLALPGAIAIINLLINR